MPEETKDLPVDRAGRVIEPGVPVNERKKPKKKAQPAVASSPSKPAKRFSFEQWAARMGVPGHHRGGLRAFVNNVSKHRTLQEWDECFKAY